MTNRGLFALLASASIGIDMAVQLVQDHSQSTIIGAAVVLAVAALVIFGAVRGYRIAFAVLALWFVMSVLSSVSDFVPIEALRKVFEPGETIAIKMTNLLTLALFSAALVVYARKKEV